VARFGDPLDELVVERLQLLLQLLHFLGVIRLHRTVDFCVPSDYNAFNTDVFLPVATGQK